MEAAQVPRWSRAQACSMLWAQADANRQAAIVKAIAILNTASIQTNRCTNWSSLFWALCPATVRIQSRVARRPKLRSKVRVCQTVKIGVFCSDLERQSLSSMQLLTGRASRRCSVGATISRASWRRKSGKWRQSSAANGCSTANNLSLSLSLHLFVSLSQISFSIYMYIYM